ncbi:hypothetical protein Poly59_25530 [Rubripirellula reticaptiva]|uniref:Uncharacterized protein n=1 Tax=Rubripirellula reticaptiva TaxID=2528013 RepID=A0A5C6F961_9BACT|nr:hypothetical protein Poly59_25530 [Rubripirellula reticaptiva]
MDGRYIAAVLDHDSPFIWVIANLSEDSIVHCTIPDVLLFLDSITSNPEFAARGEGTKVQLDVQSGVAHERITAVVTAMLEDIGWSVASRAGLIFKAEYNKHVETQQFQAQDGIPKNSNNRGS